MKAFHLCAGAVVLGLVAGCGASGSSGGGTATVQGRVLSSARPLDNARAVAIGADGRTFWSYLDVGGGFALDVAVGQSYRVIVADALAGGGQRTIGHLVIHPSSGATRWMGIHQAGVVALGALHLPGSATGTTRGTVTTQDDPPAGGDRSPSGEGSQEDVGTHEDDGETEALCSSQGSAADDDQELDADNDPGDSCSDQDASEHEQETDNEDGAPCPAADGGPSAAGSGGGSPVPRGGACTVTSNCATGLVCVSSICMLK